MSAPVDRTIEDRIRALEEAVPELLERVEELLERRRQREGVER